MKSVDVIVLNWNGWQDTVACLSSLQAQDYPSFSLLVIDNGSTDDSLLQIKKAMPSVELLQTGLNLGFGGGCNVGIKHALARGADYVWLINSDATVDPGALSALVRVAEKNPFLGSVGSVLYEADSSGQVQLWGGGTVDLWLGRSHHQKSPAALDFISGASMLLRRATIEQVGMFDQSNFFMYWEDTDLCFRLKRAGWQLSVAEDSLVWHKESASFGLRNPKLDEYFTRSAVRFLSLYAPIPFISISLMLILMLTKRILMVQVSRTRAVLKGFLGA